MRRILRGLTLTLPIALVLIAPAATSAQSVASVVEDMYDAFDRYAQGVDNYTLVQDAMGFETVSYFEKEMVDGHPVFKMRSSAVGALGTSLSGDDVGYGDVFMFGPDLIEHGRYAGREQVQGRNAHVLAIDDLTQLDLMGPSSPDDDMEFVAQSGTMYIDAETMTPLRMTFEGEATTPNGVVPVTTTIDMLDYRTIEGMPIPHRIVMSMEGLQAMVDPEMRAQLEEMEEQLASLPESQRAMMEQMMGGQIERIRQMMAGDGGPMTMETTVTEVRVNAGPPGE